jgi:hypothetical protein
MRLTPGRFGLTPTTWLATVFLFTLAMPASASYIAGDSYQTGTNPAAGQYVAGMALDTQPLSLVTPGFVNGPYGGGSGTSNFISYATGLSYPPYTQGTNNGSVEWLGANDDGLVRSVARSFSAVPSSTTYFFNILVSQDGTTTASTSSFVLAGFGNNTVPLLGATANEVQGLYIGFSGEASTGTAADLVIRYRNGMDTTADQILVNGTTTNTAAVFDVVAELTVNTSGPANGTLSYWVNPTDYTSTSTMTALSSGTIQTEAYAPAGLPTDPINNFSRLTYTADNWTGVAKFSDAEFGTTLGDVVPSVVPAPSSIVMMGIGAVGGLGLAIRRRRALASRPELN